MIEHDIKFLRDRIEIPVTDVRDYDVKNLEVMGIEFENLEYSEERANLCLILLAEGLNERGEILCVSPSILTKMEAKQESALLDGLWLRRTVEPIGIELKFIYDVYLIRQSLE